MSELRLSGGEKYIPSAQIDAREKQIADQYSEQYKQRKFLALIVRKGGLRFGEDVLRQMPNANFDIGYIDSESMNGTESTGKPKITISDETLEKIEQYDSLLFEDLDDKRITLSAIVHILNELRNGRLDVAAMLNKPTAEKVVESLEVDSIQYGFDIDDQFVVGRGLDWNQLYRELDHISVAHNIAEKGEPDYWYPIVETEPCIQQPQLWVPTYPNITMDVVARLA